MHDAKAQRGRRHTHVHWHEQPKRQGSGGGDAAAWGGEGAGGAVGGGSTPTSEAQSAIRPLVRAVLDLRRHAAVVKHGLKLLKLKISRRSRQGEIWNFFAGNLANAVTFVDARVISVAPWLYLGDPNLLIFKS